MTNDELRSDAAKILDYWRIMDMLTQDKLPGTHCQQIGKVKESSQITSERVFQTAEKDGRRPEFNLYRELYREAAALGWKKWGHIDIYIGKVPREYCVEKLAEYIRKRDPERDIEKYLPEVSRDNIALATIQLDSNGKYEKHSFSLSPIVWALNMLSKNEKLDLSLLTKSNYYSAVSEFEGFFLNSPETDTLTIDNFNLPDNEEPGSGSLNNLEHTEQKDIYLELFDEDDDDENGNADIFNEAYANDRYDSTDEEYEEIAAGHIEFERIQEAYARLLSGMKDDGFRKLCTENYIFRVPFYRGDEARKTCELARPYKDLEKADEEEKKACEPPQTYMPSLFRSYYSEDLEWLKDLVEKDTLDYSNLGGELLRYINVLNDNPAKENRTDLLYRTGGRPSGYYDMMRKILNPRKSPIGRWPSRWRLSLMQQAAVNLAAEGDPKQKIFSINGPPGTGKTTLLKDIIVRNIIEKAALLSDADYAKPDDAFERLHLPTKPWRTEYYYTFKDGELGEKINALGILVASNNNAAVENISKELPLDFSRGLLDGNSGKNDKNGKVSVRERLKMRKEEEEERAINEIGALFSSRDENDGIREIYFTKESTALLNRKGQKTVKSWGLVSAAMGKRANISMFTLRTLKELLEFGKDRKEKYVTDEEIGKYRTSLEEFRNQLEVVEYYRDQLSRYAGIIEEVSLSELRLDEYREILGKYTPQEIDVDRKLQRRMMKTGCGDRVQQIEREARIKLYDEARENIGRAENEYYRLCRERDDRIAELDENVIGEVKVKFDGSFLRRLISGGKESEDAQTANPWMTSAYDREREKLFRSAMTLIRDFIMASSACLTNLRQFKNHFWQNRKKEEAKAYNIYWKRRGDVVPVLFQTAFLFVPVMSTTFASVGRFLRDLRKAGSIGTLIIDEAGQASPQIALGAIYRSRRAVIVGDPYQVEPVVTDDLKLLKEAFRTNSDFAGTLEEYISNDKELSVQTFADRMNRWGTVLGDNWVGCPLLVHRRCISPMFEISNAVSYENKMVYRTAGPKESEVRTFTLPYSTWFNVEGRENGNKDHYVKAQGEKVCSLLEKAFEKSWNEETQKSEPDIFIITPFTTVQSGICNEIENYWERRKNTENPSLIDREYMRKRIGTVHKFQGKEASEVIFVLGCDSSAPGAVRWVSSNIVNVAVTRAKYRLYVVGDSDVWKGNNYVSTAWDIMRKHLLDEFISIASSSESDDAKKKKLLNLSESLDSFSTVNPEKRRKVHYDNLDELDLTARNSEVADEAWDLLEKTFAYRAIPF